MPEISLTLNNQYMLNVQRFVVNPFQENCYVVYDETKEAVIVDCGAFYPEERSAIVKFIRDNELSPRHLIATHGHVDHNFGNGTVFSAFGLLPEVHQKDASLMNRLSEQAMAFCQYEISGNVPEVGAFFDDGDNIAFGRHKLAVIPTPGHTPGSVFFYCEEDGVAFSGDTLFKMSIGRTDLWEGSYEDLVLSLNRIKALLDGETVLLPGHGPQTTMADELRVNPYLR